jgi:RNA polymerase sigma factor (sigma-70 family)
LENTTEPAADGLPAVAYEMASRRDSREGQPYPAVDRRKAERRQLDRRRQAAQPDLFADHIARTCTSREQQTLRLLLSGMTNKEIAQQLGIAEDTVKKHLQHVYKKLGVRRRAVLLAARARQP